MRISRREFLRYAFGTCAGCIFASSILSPLDLFAQDASKTTRRLMDRKWWKALDNKRAQCFICPLNCILEDGQTCFCRTRKNIKGEFWTYAYNNPCIMVPDDPIEKLPLCHFLPGEKTFSLATGGCNLRCLYCQNWQISQSRPETLKNFYLPAEKAVEIAKEKKLKMMAYTYTEPVVFSEYMLEIATLAKQKKIKNVCATAAFINKEPLKELCKVIDGFAVSLKAFDDKFYEKVCGQSLKPVLDALATIKEQKVWLEVVNLVVPTYNDDLKKIKEMCEWLKKNLGADTPLHFGRFVPEYKLKDLPRTPQQTLEKCREIGLETGIKYVYIFNLSPHEGNHTYCPKCKTVLIRRLGFKILENKVEKGTCPKCKSKIPGVWALDELEK